MKKDKKLEFNFSAKFKDSETMNLIFASLIVPVLVKRVKKTAKTCTQFFKLKKLRKHAFILFSSVEKLKNYGNIFSKLKQAQKL